MEKTCEFCAQLRPVVYCKADAARLCLSCDARVHSANALSNRHFRSLICEECGNLSATVWCLDHRMFMCCGCDRNLHEASDQHQKRVINSYMGCPSAKDFAALWGYELNELGYTSPQGQFVPTSLSYGILGVANLDIPREFCPRIECSSLTSEVNSMTSVFGADSEVGSSNLESKIFHRNKQQQDSHFILQQILDLKRLQHSERKNHPSLIHGQMQTDIYSSKYNNSGQLDEDLGEHSMYVKGLGIDLRQKVCLYHELQVQPFPLPVPQLEHLTSSSSSGIPLHGDSFWQCKSPTQSSQLWSQNMQDLGICEENDCCDGFNIPDVDLTFRNYEELFGGDQDQTRALFDENDVAWSSMEKDMSLDKSNNGYPRESEDVSVASSVYITQISHEYKKNHPSDQAHYFATSVGSPCPIRPSYSTLSVSLSRISVESTTADYINNGLSPNIIRGEPPWNSRDLENAPSQSRENAMMRYEKQIRYTSRKARADLQKRVKGRFSKAEGYESDTVDVT